MRRFAVAALALLLTGCLSDSIAAPATDLAGTWTLSSVNGNPLPFTYPNGSQVTDGRLSIDLNGSYTSVAHYTSGTTHNEEGGYTVLGNLVVFSDATDGVTYQASWNSTTITQEFGSYTLLYRKQ